MMAYIRAKKKRGKNYYYVVEGTRDEEGKVKQKILKYLGTVERVMKTYKFLEDNQ